MDYHKVGGVDDLADGEMKAVQVDGEDVLLARVEGCFYAVHGICSHALGYLDEGELEGFEVFCPLHDGSFDIRTGEPLAPPAVKPVKCYAVRVEAGEVLVALHDPASGSKG